MSAAKCHPLELAPGRASSSLPKACAPGPWTDEVPSGLTAESSIGTGSLPWSNVTAAGPAAPSVLPAEGSPDRIVRGPDEVTSTTAAVRPSHREDPETVTQELPPVPVSATYKPPGPKASAWGPFSPLATTVTVGVLLPWADALAGAAADTPSAT